MVSRESIGILSTGVYLPKRVMTGREIAAAAGLPVDVVERKMGIVQKPIPGDDDHTCEMGARAARKAIAGAGIDPETIDVVGCRRRVQGISRMDRRDSPAAAGGGVAGLGLRRVPALRDAHLGDEIGEGHDAGHPSSARCFWPADTGMWTWWITGTSEPASCLTWRPERGR